MVRAECILLVQSNAHARAIRLYPNSSMGSHPCGWASLVLSMGKILNESDTCSERVKISQGILLLCSGYRVPQFWMEFGLEHRGPSEDIDNILMGQET